MPASVLTSVRPNGFEQGLIIEWLCQNSTALPLGLHSICVSPWAVMKTIGIRQSSAFSFACNSRPDIPGMRISVIRQAVPAG